MRLFRVIRMTRAPHPPKGAALVSFRRAEITESAIPPIGESRGSTKGSSATFNAKV
jgi:hypothetical protein